MSDTGPIEGVELEDFIRGLALLEQAPNDVGAVVRALALRDVDTWRHAELGWRARTKENRQLARIVRLFVAEQVKELRGEPLDDDGDEDAQDDTAPAPVHARHDVPSFMQVPSAPPAVIASPPPASPLSAPTSPPLARPVSAPQPPRLHAVAPASETAPLDLERLRSIVLANPTPFLGKTSPDRLQKLRAESAASEETLLQRSAQGGDETDETVMFQPTAAQREALQTLPFEAGKGRVVFPAMDVVQYASFVAQLEVRGVSAEVLVKHGITTPQALQALHAEQERRFEMDRAQRAHFEERKAHFKRFIKV